MKTSVAVIGANFGDEGKGHMVDYLATGSSLVVRFNGGAQAGHTVEANGQRRVFSHFGSGMMKGASTYLSRDFIVNPLLWHKEHCDGEHLFIDAEAIVTTPYDMLLNREIARYRSHGTCGLGINETVGRSEGTTKIVARDLKNPDRLRVLLRYVREYALRRMAALEIEPSEKFHDPAIELQFLDIADRMEFTCVNDHILGNFDHVVFEGAQGLLLDEKHKFFPHVTRSRTGVHNIMHYHPEVVYVTRSYLTRHGAGPLPSEDESMKYEDKTNATNEWQGRLRFAPLDLDLLRETIESQPTMKASLAVTCLDQHWIDVGKLARILPVRYRSYGPDRKDIKEAL